MPLQQAYADVPTVSTAVTGDSLIGDSTATTNIILDFNVDVNATIPNTADAWSVAGFTILLVTDIVSDDPTCNGAGAGTSNMTITLTTALPTDAIPDVTYNGTGPNISIRSCDTNSPFENATSFTPTDGLIPTMDSATTTSSTTIDAVFSEDIASGSVSTVRTLTDEPCSVIGSVVPYVLGECDCIGIFSPEAFAAAAERYVVSVWVKEAASDPPVPVFDYSNVTVNVTGNPFLVTTIATNRSDIIDGWQRIEVVFEIPSGSSIGDITIQLINNNSTLDAFFDDIRIHPFNANMKSFVYHPVTLRLMAELDENNYATFYEYDEEGALIRAKKETVRGIKTIQESRNSTFKTTP